MFLIGWQKSKQALVCLNCIFIFLLVSIALYAEDEMEIVAYHPFIPNLMLREGPGRSYNKIDILNQAEYVRLLQIGKFEVIDDKPGRWLNVQTATGTIGWCFDGYLMTSCPKCRNSNFKTIRATREISREQNPRAMEFSFILVECPRRLEFDFLYSTRALLLYEKASGEVLQVYKMEDETDNLKLSISKDFGQQMVRIDFILDIFTTGPIHRNGTRYLFIEPDGRIGQTYFQYFSEWVQDGYPSANLKEMRIISDRIRLTYEFYENLGFPKQGSGDFNLIYSYDSVGVKLIKIESSIVRSEILKSGTPVAIEPPEKIIYGKDDLNTRFSTTFEDNSVYQFVF